MTVFVNITAKLSFIPKQPLDTVLALNVLGYVHLNLPVHWNRTVKPTGQTARNVEPIETENGYKKIFFQVDATTARNTSRI